MKKLAKRSASTRSLLAIGMGCALLLASPAGAAKIEGVEFSDRVSLGGTPLELQGLALLRYKVIFKGYVAALYLQDAADSQRVLEDVPRQLEIEYFWSIPASAFADATVDGIRKNVGPSRFRALEPEIARFSALYRDVRPGDRYQVSYRPGRGTELALNGQPLGLIPGADFASALFAIWLGDEPFSQSLKDQLLKPSADRG